MGILSLNGLLFTYFLGQLAQKIGEEKSIQGKNTHFHVPQREHSILDRLKGQNKGPFPWSSINSIFREVFSATLALEKPLRIAFLGPDTTFTHQVAVKPVSYTHLTLPTICSV